MMSTETRTRCIPKKLGKNAIVSALLKSVHPTSFWKSDEVGWQNCYHDCHLKFKVDDLFINSASKSKLWLSSADYPGKSFHALVGAVKIVKAGSPNQLFFGEARTACQQACHPVCEPIEDEAEDEDVKPIEDEALEGNSDCVDVIPDNEGNASEEDLDGPSTVGNWNWSAFMDTISTDARGAVEKLYPSLKNVNYQAPKSWTPIEFFNFFMPWTYFENHIVPATSNALRSAKKKPTSLPEIKKWLGIWLLMSLKPQYSMMEFFETDRKRTRGHFWNPPPCGEYVQEPVQGPPFLPLFDFKPLT